MTDNTPDFTNPWFNGGPGVFRDGAGKLWIRNEKGNWREALTVPETQTVGMTMRDNGEIEIDDPDTGMYKAVLPIGLTIRYQGFREIRRKMQAELWDWYCRAGLGEWDDDE